MLFIAQTSDKETDFQMNVSEHYSIIAKPAEILGIFEQTTHVTAIWNPVNADLAFFTSKSSLPIAEVFWYIRVSLLLYENSLINQTKRFTDSR